jgi:hypothetical protein
MGFTLQLTDSFSLKSLTYETKSKKGPPFFQKNSTGISAGYCCKKPHRNLAPNHGYSWYKCHNGEYNSRYLRLPVSRIPFFPKKAPALRGLFTTKIGRLSLYNFFLGVYTNSAVVQLSIFTGAKNNNRLLISHLQNQPSP